MTRSASCRTNRPGSACAAARTGASSRYRSSDPGNSAATSLARVLLPVCLAPLITTTLVSASAPTARPGIRSCVARARRPAPAPRGEHSRVPLGHRYRRQVASGDAQWRNQPGRRLGCIDCSAKDFAGCVRVSPAGFEPALTAPESVAVYAPGLPKRVRRSPGRARIGRGRRTAASSGRPEESCYRRLAVSPLSRPPTCPACWTSAAGAAAAMPPPWPQPCRGRGCESPSRLGKPLALDVGQTFAIREGGRAVGAGTIIALLSIEKAARDSRSRTSPHR
jgi:hypothetical protein